ncbi:MAG: YicC/YloC family endoribonuclease [Nitrospirota bacterium]
MAQSMTGFGSAEKDGYRVEVRSLNHRFLDIYIKAPAFLSQYEINLRNLLKERFSRGKFDINIAVSAHENTEFLLDAEFARKIFEAFKKLGEELSIPGDLDINTMSSFYEMFVETKQKYNVDTIVDIFKQAMEDLHKMRIKEGEALTAELRQMTDSLSIMNGKIRALCSGTVASVAEKFSERLGILLAGKDIDGNRILQEAAIIASKLDITEETARIESHLRQFGEILSDGDIIGRKLDFIVQELNREVNTIASKSADYNISSLTVDMKAEIEKIREQVQNIQ